MADDKRSRSGDSRGRGGSGKPRKPGAKSRAGSPQPRTGGKQTGGKQRSSKGGSSRQGQRRGQAAKPQRASSQKRRDLSGAAVHLPRHVVESIERTTPKERVAGALQSLGSAVEAFTDGKFHRALDQARRAKNLAPRDSTVREVLGLAAYRVGDWQTALAELRTYRRLAGETTHLPIEMDVLRALNRGDDVDAAWKELNRRGGSKATMAEGRVVYASHLIDKGHVEEARKLVRPSRLGANPHPGDLRVWFVAARAAALQDDPDEARRIADAIVAADPGFPGFDDLESEIRKARGRVES